jgi:hypothetical protein
MTDDSRTCPDCNEPLPAIRLIDRAHAQEHDVEYTLPSAKRSFWTGAYPKEGRVEAFMCSHCGRITLYGVPKAK